MAEENERAHRAIEEVFEKFTCFLELQL